jgi:ABC-type transporter Mla MlaB component
LNQVNSAWDEWQGKLSLPEIVDISVLPKLIKQNSWLSLPVKEVDFTAVDKADSAVLAVLLYWAQQSETKLKVVNFPQQLDNLIELYDLNSIIAIK